jgi:DNA-binding protein HU-beta
MNQAELIDAIASKTGQPKTTVRQGLKALIETLTETLAQGESVNIPGFGAFKCVQREARNGRNPATGETITIGPSTVPRFVPGKALKDTVHG